MSNNNITGSHYRHLVGLRKRLFCTSVVCVSPRCREQLLLLKTSTSCVSLTPLVVELLRGGRQYVWFSGAAVVGLAVWRLLTFESFRPVRPDCAQTCLLFQQFTIFQKGENLRKQEIMDSSSNSNQNKQFYLSDAVINDYMKLIITYYESDVYVLVKRRARKVDIFLKKKLIFPINLKAISHWAWSILHRPLELKQSNNSLILRLGNDYDFIFA
ncbi:hypothetical protein AGLY_001603 [Aphis glycines]|uniref:Uncharacterized protein n=1 Tax=Aphis glycines TaxID=307491 RepID=A0A6G0U5S4_APHGL|nr:hypothetical protein AGLY_001603 [Aphis glycines]